jgi:uncharacterized repeat protein (TIGR02543 family)
MSLSRKFLWILSLFFVLFIAACTEAVDKGAILDQATNQVQVPGETSTSLTLPANIEIEGLIVTIAWSTSNAMYLTSSGVVTRPSFSVGNQTVILTATFSYEELTTQENYTVVILALPAVTYVVSFESNGGSAVTSQNVTEGQLVTKPTDPVRSGFTFEGWYLEATWVTPFAFLETIPTSNLILYAKWQAIPTFTVSFIPDNGTNIPNQTVFLNGLVMQPTDPVKPGYTFVNWVKEDLTVWNFQTTPVTSNVTLFAQYTLITYTVTYVIPAGATLGSGGITSYTVLDPINDLGSATKDYSDFLGWFDSAVGGNKVTGYPAGTTGNITLYARFEDHIPLVISFDDQMGSVVTQHRWEGQYAEPIADPIKPGYTFVGWFIHLSDLEPFNFATMIVQDTYLLAKYEIITYSISYDLKGGTASNPITYTVETDDILFNYANKTGHSFIGWTYTDGSGDIVTTLPKGSTGHKMLYATFVEIDYFITYHLNGGTLAVSNPLVYTISSSFVLSEPTKEGYVFEGWYTHVTEGVMIESIEPGRTGHLVLYARFVELVSISFFDEGKLNIDLYIMGDQYPYTEFVLTTEGLLYAKGSNEFGQLGNGKLQNENRWIHITPYLNLTNGETIHVFSFVGNRVLVLTSSGRVLTWGYFYKPEMSDPVFSNVPVDVTGAFNLASGTIVDLYHYGEFFVVKTSSNTLILYEDDTQTSVNPLYTGTGGQTVSPLYTGSHRPSLFFIIAGAYYVINPSDTHVEFLNITAQLDVNPLQPVYAMFSEDRSIHILNGNTYIYGFFTGSTETPFMVLRVPMSVTLNPEESVISSTGSLMFTNQGRLLVSVFIVDDMDDELPSLIKFIDITSHIDLLEGEAISQLLNPGFILTTLNRLLIPQINDLFSTDPDFVPIIMMMAIDFAPHLKIGEEILSIDFSGQPIIITSLGYKTLQFISQESFIVVDFVILGTTLVHEGDYPINQLELFVPEDRPFEDFAGWYEDEALTIPFNPETVTSGMYLFAKWERTHYVVEFGYEWDPMGISKVWALFGETPVQPEDPEKALYVFGGWYYYDSEGQYTPYDFSYPLDIDTRLYPIWNPSESDVNIFLMPIMQNYSKKGYDYYQAKAMPIDVPEGYEVVGIYLDEAMTILAGEDDLIADYKTLYVLVQAVTYEIYYVESYETVSFNRIFQVEQTLFGITSEDQIFGWGSNSNGAIGFGNDSIYWIDTPINITSHLGLLPGETIVDIQGGYSMIVVLTSFGRMFAWGYQDSSFENVTIPVQITSWLNLEEETITDYLVGYGLLYVFTNSGSVKELRLKDGQVTHYASTLSVMNNLLIYRSYYGGYDTLVVLPSAIYMLQFSFDYTIESIDFSSVMGGGTVIAIEKSYVGYMAYEVYLSNGLVLLLDINSQSVTVNRTILLLESETIVRFIPGNGLAPFVFTSQNRLIELSYEGEPVVYDTTALLPNEFVLSRDFGGVLTNFGRQLFVDSDLGILSMPSQAFDIGMATVIRYDRIDWMFVAYTSEHEFVLAGETKMLYQKVAASVIDVEFYEYGNVFVPRVPMGPDASEFLYWSTNLMYPYPYEGIPYSDMFLFGIYTQE